MRLATCIWNGSPRAALVGSDDSLVPVSSVLPGAPNDMLGVIEAGPLLWDKLRAVAPSIARGLPLASAQLLAPIPHPRRNVLCIGWNYSEHFAEGSGMRGGNPDPEKIPDFPAMFSKQPNTVIGPGAAILHSAPASDQLDWEAELGVVIGTAGRDIPEGDAYSHIFGYTAANDVSVRDVQRRHGGQWFKGKNFDTHLPLGPVIVTTDEIPDPHTLGIATRVNGVVKQDSSTKYMVFKVPRIIAEFSLGMELEPGDVLITGTPNGVGWVRKPPEFMYPGDTVEVEIEKIGVLRNPIIAR